MQNPNLPSYLPGVHLAVERYNKDVENSQRDAETARLKLRIIELETQLAARKGPNHE